MSRVQLLMVVRLDRDVKPVPCPRCEKLVVTGHVTNRGTVAVEFTPAPFDEANVLLLREGEMVDGEREANGFHRLHTTCENGVRTVPGPVTRLGRALRERHKRKRFPAGIFALCVLDSAVLFICACHSNPPFSVINGFVAGVAATMAFVNLIEWLARTSPGLIREKEERDQKTLAVLADLAKHRAPSATMPSLN